MNERDRLNRVLEKRPHAHVPFFQRPQWTRRRFFRSLAAGVGGYYLAGPWSLGLSKAAAAVETNEFKSGTLDQVAVRPDALGRLARVFQRMAREVHARARRTHHPERCGVAVA